jgi:hypothetical protein
MLLIHSFSIIKLVASTLTFNVIIMGMNPYSFASINPLNARAFIHLLFLGLGHFALLFANVKNLVKSKLSMFCLDMKMIMVSCMSGNS